MQRVKRELLYNLTKTKYEALKNVLKRGIAQNNLTWHITSGLTDSPVKFTAIG